MNGEMDMKYAIYKIPHNHCKECADNGLKSVLEHLRYALNYEWWEDDKYLYVKHPISTTKAHERAVMLRAKSFAGTVEYVEE